MHTFEELQSADKERIIQIVSKEIYRAALIFESLENAGRIFGNGHHMAQDFVKEAMQQLENRWINK